MEPQAEALLHVFDAYVKALQPLSEVVPRIYALVVFHFRRVTVNHAPWLEALSCFERAAQSYYVSVFSCAASFESSCFPRLGPPASPGGPGPRPARSSEGPRAGGSGGCAHRAGGARVSRHICERAREPV